MEGDSDWLLNDGIEQRRRAILMTEVSLWRDREELTVAIEDVSYPFVKTSY